MRPSNKEVHARLMVLKSVLYHAYACLSPDAPDGNPDTLPDEERRAFNEQGRNLTAATNQALRRAGLWRYVSPRERVFLTSYGSNANRQAAINATWRNESAGMLVWALGLVEPFRSVGAAISYDELEMVSIDRVGMFSKHPPLRPEAEIDAKRDLMEFWHWRVRTRRLIEEGRPFQASESMKAQGLHSFDDIVRHSARLAYEQGDLSEIIDNDLVIYGKAFRAISREEYHRASSTIQERHLALNWLCGYAPKNRWDETPTDT
jgi:hypothetical protein